MPRTGGHGSARQRFRRQVDPLLVEALLAALNRGDLHALRPYVAVWCVLSWLTALTRRRSMQLLKHELTAHVEPRVKDFFRFSMGLRPRLAQSHVPQMVVDNMSGRQPGHDTRDEQDPGDDDSQVIDLTQAQEEVRNRVDGRHDIESKERRKCKFQRRNAFVSKESPAQPELIAYAAIEKRTGAGESGRRSSLHFQNLPAVDVCGGSTSIRLENVKCRRHVPPAR